jgi:hypothetical protein
MQSETVAGYKAFNEHFQCTPKNEVFQYEVGKTYEEPNAVLCKSGFHFCENPLDLFGYYPPTGRFAEIHAEQVSERDPDDDSKRAAKKLTIVAEISLAHLLGLGVKFILERVQWDNARATNTGYRSAATNTGYRSAATNTGNRSAATNTGYQSAATNTGDQSAATNTGYRSAATNTGYQSAATNTGYQSAATNTGDQSAATNTGDEGCAVSLGIEGRAKGALGCWLTLAEWRVTKNDEWHRIDVKTKKVDGKRIKPDRFYQLKGGKFVEAQNGE